MQIIAEFIVTNDVFHNIRAQIKDENEKLKLDIEDWKCRFLEKEEENEDLQKLSDLSGKMDPSSRDSEEELFRLEQEL